MRRAPPHPHPNPNPHRHPRPRPDPLPRPRPQVTSITVPCIPLEPKSLPEAFLIVPDGDDGDVQPSNMEAARVQFLGRTFTTYKELDEARKLMGLNISQSSKAKTRVRYRDKNAPKKGHLLTFRYNIKCGNYQRAKGSGARSVESILEEWKTTSPTGEPQEKFEAYSGRRRSDVIWTHAAACMVLDLVDTTKISKRYTNTQIAEQLNRPETEHLYKHPQDQGRQFTAGSLGLLGLGLGGL